MNVAAVVVTHNSAEHIEPTLSALADAGVATVVVDNASTDHTLAVLATQPVGTVVANHENLGFATAVNQGLGGEAASDADVALLVNPDCVVPPATVSGLVAHLAAHPEVAVAGPRLVGPDGTVAVSAHPFESFRSVVLSRFGGSLVPVRLRRLASGRDRRRTYDACLDPGPPASVDWVSGACLAVRRQVLAETGGLDERYFLYYEDEELCWQVRERGYDIHYVPSLEAMHIGGASSEVGATWPHLYRSMLVFFAAHRRSRFHAVRGAVLMRAVIGMATALARSVGGAAGGPARRRAWFSVAVVAWETRLRELEEAQ